MSHIRIKFHIARAAAMRLPSTGLLQPEPAAGQNTTGPAMEAGAHEERGHDARDLDQGQFEVSGNGEPVDRSIETAAADADAGKIARAAAMRLPSTGLLPLEPAAGQNTTGRVMEAGAHDERGHDARDLDQGQFEVSGNGEPVDRSIETAAAGTDAGKLDQGWRLARQAALDSIQGNPGQNVFYAVFAIHATSGGYTEFAAKPGGIKTARAEATTFIVEPQS